MRPPVRIPFAPATRRCEPLVRFALLINLAIRRDRASLPAPPITVAALGDAMTRLAGELADAWMPFLYPRSHLQTGAERLREGATRGGHSDRLPEIHPNVPTVVADSESKAREGAAWFVALYLTTMGHSLPRIAQPTGLWRGRQGGPRGECAEVHGRCAGRCGGTTRAVDRIRDAV
jgi:alkanesulfonate monooxygenase SsuD/methylene tetrahydromethanopterin reductase-like flavin-dependent oxidoreductase (luciferase family)